MEMIEKVIGIGVPAAMQKKVARILTGSCTPANDLAELADAGELSLDLANRAYQLTHSAGPFGVRPAAHYEAAHMKALGI